MFIIIVLITNSAEFIAMSFMFFSPLRQGEDSSTGTTINEPGSFTLGIFLYLANSI
jgi:hypothetical protein